MDGKPGSHGGRRPGKVVAVLDIGSSSLRMGIYQKNKEAVQRLSCWIPRFGWDMRSLPSDASARRACGSCAAL